MDPTLDIIELDISPALSSEMEGQVVTTELTPEIKDAAIDIARNIKYLDATANDVINNSKTLQDVIDWSDKQVAMADDLIKKQLEAYPGSQISDKTMKIKDDAVKILESVQGAVIKSTLKELGGIPE